MRHFPLSLTVRAALFTLIALASIYFGFLHFDHEFSRGLSALSGYWVFVALFCCFGVSIKLAYGATIWRYLSDRANWVTIIGCAAATIFLYTREAEGFKILFDEHNLANAAKHIHETRLPLLEETAHVEGPEVSVLDKRPFLFPVLLATVHDIFGYRIENPFYLNGFLTFLFLLLLHRLLSQVHGRSAGWLGVALTCASPLIAQNASGGGFEILNVVGILVCILLATELWKEPDNPHRFSAFILATAAFSQVRYESPLIIVPAALLILGVWIRNQRVSFPWGLIVTPIFFIPFALQQSYVVTNKGFEQYVYDSDGLFSLSYMFNNLGHAAGYLFYYPPMSTSNPAVHAVGLIALVAIIARFITQPKAFLRDPSKSVAAAYMAVVILGFLIVLSFTFGQLDNPIVTRLGLPFVALLIATGAIGLSHLRESKQILKLPVYSILAISILLSFSVYGRRADEKHDRLNQRISWLIDFAKEHEGQNNLFVTHYTQIFELHDYYNMSIGRANANPEELAFHLAVGTWDRIFVIQSGFHEFSDEKLEERILGRNEFSDKFRLETLKETSFIPYNFTRISRAYQKSAGQLKEEQDKEIERPFITNQGSNVLFKEASPKELEAWRNSIP